jgi:hypothetical protein
MSRKAYFAIPVHGLFRRELPREDTYIQMDVIYAVSAGSQQ